MTFLSSKNVIPSKTSPTSVEPDELGRKIESQSNMLSSLLTELKANKKLLNDLALKARDLNLIIDGFAEIPNEDTLPYVVGLLAKFIPCFEGKMIDNALDWEFHSEMGLRAASF